MKIHKLLIKTINPFESVIRYVLIILFLFFLTEGFANQNNFQFSPTDSLKFNHIMQVSVSSNGKKVAFSVFRMISVNSIKQFQAFLYMKNVNNRIQLIATAPQISSPIFSPDDSQLAFLAPGTNHESIWVYSFDDSRLKKLFEFNSDITAFKWSPNGNQIAFVASLQSNPTNNTHNVIKTSNNIYSSQLFLLALQTSPIQAEPLTPLTYNIASDFSDPGFDWSQNEKEIAFVYLTNNSENAYKIALINLTTKTITNLPYAINHPTKEPIYSPDGKWLAFLSNPAGANHLNLFSQDINYNTRVCVANISTLTTSCLANTPNENPLIIGWSSDNQNIFVADNDKTFGPQLYKIPLNTAKPVVKLTNVTGYIEPSTISINKNHSVFGFGYETQTKAPEVFISPTSLFNLQQISQFNDSTPFTFGHTKVISWQSKDGMKIEGLLSFPAQYNPKKSYPLLVMVHGGPAGVWSQQYLGGCSQFGTMIDPSSCWGNFLNMGFIIFEPNPRGSTGYGIDFRLGNYQDWGGGDAQDIISGVNYLIQQKIADPNHLAIIGWSYGGYLTNWIISQNHQFKAAVSGDGPTDLISLVGTTMIPEFLKEYFGGYYWNNYHLYLQRSPIYYVKNITTPLLILHGANDPIVPITQAYELYYALSQQHKQVKMLVLPAQMHVPTDANIIDQSMKEINQWLKIAL